MLVLESNNSLNLLLNMFENNNHSLTIPSIKRSEMKELVVSDEVFSYLKPTVVVMKYFGLAPIVYSFENGKYTLRKSTTYILYSYTIALALAGWAFLGLWMDATSEFSFRVKNKNDIYVTLSDIGGVILSVLTGILLGPLKIEALFDIIHSLDNINHLLNESKHSLQWERFNSVFFICAVYIISTFILILDLYSWSERTSTTELSVAYLKNYLSFYLFYFVLITQQLAYSNLSLHVRRRIKALNRILAEEIIEKCEGKENKGYIFWIKMEERGIVERFMSRNETVELYSKNADKIRVFPEAYEEVQNCIQAINEFFDYPLLFILITCFIHLIITIWGILVEYYTRWLFLIMNLVWILIQTGRLLFVVEPIHSCLAEMSKIKPLVAKLVAEEKEIGSHLNVIVKRIKTPSQQFTAAGIVTIGRPILSTIAGAVTTYLVILYQFHSEKRVD